MFSWFLINLVWRIHFLARVTNEDIVVMADPGPGLLAMIDVGVPIITAPPAMIEVNGRTDLEVSLLGIVDLQDHIGLEAGLLATIGVLHKTVLLIRIGPYEDRLKSESHCMY